MKRRLVPDPTLVERFARDLDQLAGREGPVGIAVSGGADSLSLLLLAAAARPDRIAVATVDHRLRAESAAEARFVGEICATLGVPHATLPVDVASGASLQAQARHARYRALGDWAAERGLAAVATAHHADDQAETLLMRLARGAGLSGLAATRARRPLAPGIALVRPLLGWRRGELRAIVEAAGIEPIDDPANRDPRHDRSRFRGLLERADWAEPERLASSASWLAEADEALEWALAPLIATRLSESARTVVVDPEGLPREMQRRLLLAAIERLGGQRPRGPELERAMRALADGRSVTLGGLKLSGGAEWRIAPAPPRGG
jgi:tRNA(Ile)-lysidine synthase